MENNKFKIGDIVKYKDDDNNRYKIIDIIDDNTLRVESLISGTPYVFMMNSVELDEDELDEGDLHKPEIVDYNGFTLDVGDPVRIHGNASSDVYYITETKLMGEWYVKLRNRHGHDSGFHYAQGVELVTDRYVPKKGDYVKYHNAGDVVYMVLEVISKDQVRAYRVNDGKVMDIFSLELEKASAEELMGAHGEYVKSVSDMMLTRCDDTGRGKDGKMEKTGFKIGDVVKRKYDDNNRFKITAINEDGTLRTESVINGNVYFFQPGQIEPDEDDLCKPEIVDCNGFTLEAGDPVRIHGDTSGSVYYIAELNLVNRERYAKLKDKDDYNHGFFNTSRLELVMDSANNLCGKDGSGKDDRADGKPRWELLPLDAIEEIVRVYTMGAEKYADNAWKTIPDAHRRYLAALFRHIAAYERGERKDKESGLSHLAHAAWNAIAILWLDMHGDDKNQE